MWDEAVSAQDYAFPWDRLIADFKFHARIDLAPLLAERLASAVLAAGAAAVDLVVPVPLADSRLVERGFNQAWEVARRLAARLRLEADARLLIRAFETPHQAGLPRAQRESNLRGAFAVLPAGGARIAGRSVALVDDVLTTGATAREATAALRRAGAASVAVWTVARTP